MSGEGRWGELRRRAWGLPEGGSHYVRSAGSCGAVQGATRSYSEGGAAWIFVCTSVLTTKPEWKTKQKPKCCMGNTEAQEGPSGLAGCRCAFSALALQISLLAAGRYPKGSVSLPLNRTPPPPIPP